MRQLSSPLCLCMQAEQKVGIEGRRARLFLSPLPLVQSPPFLSLSSTAVHQEGSPSRRQATGSFQKVNPNLLAPGSSSFLTPFQGQAAMDQAEHFLRNSRRKCRQEKSFGQHLPIPMKRILCNPEAEGVNFNQQVESSGANLTKISNPLAA